jgi:hypothetical protein
MALDARVSTMMYVLFGLLVGFALVFHLTIAILHQGVPWVEFAVIGFLSLLLLLGMVCLRRVRILIDESTLSYTPPLSRTRVIRFAEIESATLRVAQRNLQRLVLVAETANQPSRSRVIISLEFFSKRDLKLLFGILDARGVRTSQL